MANDHDIVAGRARERHGVADVEQRLRALCDLSVAAAREEAGRHEYDGVIQDLSVVGVRSALAALSATADGAACVDQHDEACISTAALTRRVRFGELELHRVDPMLHIENLELGVYERTYASPDERDAAVRKHLDAFADGAAAAVDALDRVPRGLADAALPAARELVETATRRDHEAAAVAAARLVRHLEQTAVEGNSNEGLGEQALTRLLSASEEMTVDLSDLLAQAAAEEQRMTALLDESCRRIDATAPIAATVRALQADHPRVTDIMTVAESLTAEIVAWVDERGVVPNDGSECIVTAMPEPRRAPAALVAACPYEADRASEYRVNMPDVSWSAADQERWLTSYFNHSFMSAICVHEVAPGHHSHMRALRRLGSDVRKTLMSDAFIEGWATYAEELMVEEGFRADDPRFVAGIALSALERETRMVCTIRLQCGDMAIDEAEQRFRDVVFFDGPAARRSALRCAWDPSLLRYTWGKLAIRSARERARKAWGAGFSMRRFHDALFALGAPPLGLLDTAIERG